MNRIENQPFIELKSFQTIEDPQDLESGVEAEKKKVPRRVVHCSDGVYEEYSTDEEDLQEQRRQKEEMKKRALIDPKALPWLPWFIHMSRLAGSTIFTYCDNWGERLAWTFGITSPKYYWEIQEFKKMQQEEEERKRELAENSKGWKQNEDGSEIVQQPLDASHLKESEFVLQQNYDVTEESAKTDFSFAEEK